VGTKTADYASLIRPTNLASGMEIAAAIGTIFRCVAIFNNKDASFINHFPVGMVIAFTLNC
jgi:hypothetical protein